MPIFESEFRDAGFVELAEVFGDHAVVLLTPQHLSVGPKGAPSLFSTAVNHSTRAAGDIHAGRHANLSQLCKKRGKVVVGRCFRRARRFQRR